MLSSTAHARTLMSQINRLLSIMTIWIASRRWHKELRGRPLLIGFVLERESRSLLKGIVDLLCRFGAGFKMGQRSRGSHGKGLRRPATPFFGAFCRHKPVLILFICCDGCCCFYLLEFGHYLELRKWFRFVCCHASRDVYYFYHAID